MKTIISKMSILLLLLGLLCGCSSEGEQSALTIQESDSEVVDLGYTDSDELTGDVADAYQKAIEYELANPPYEDYETDIHYGVGDIDGDEIPELFMIRGEAHVDTVTIYTYDIETDTAIYIGDFGGYGSCQCVLGENKIISSYGNGGYYFTCVTEIGEDDAPVLIEAILNDGSKEEIKSYYGFDLGEFTGAMPRGNYDINIFGSIGEEYEISQDDADAINNRIYTDSISINMDYCSNIAKCE